MRFWNKDPESWLLLGEITRAEMIAHYRIHHLREAHTSAMQTEVSDLMAKKGKNTESQIVNPFGGWTGRKT